MQNQNKPPFKSGTLKRQTAAQIAAAANVTPDDAAAATDQSGPTMRALLRAQPIEKAKP